MRLALNKLVTLGLSLLLGACATQYSVSEAEMQQYLNRELRIDAKQSKGPMGAEFRLLDVKVRLGEKPETMAVSAHSRITLKTPLMPLSANLRATFEAKPWYNSDNHSIYLRELKLVEVESDPRELQQALNLVSPQLMAAISRLLETQPVYVLDTKDSNQALMAKMTKRIEVQPGKLALIFKP
jgi:hypothetical protein